MTQAESFHAWLKDTARRLREDDAPPSGPQEARRRAEALRRRIQAAEGDWPREKAPLDPRVLGTLEREGYRVERLLLQTRAGCYATANVYVPAGGARFPAVLCVHGHWAGARMDPVV